MVLGRVEAGSQSPGEGTSKPEREEELGAPQSSLTGLCAGAQSAGVRKKETGRREQQARWAGFEKEFGFVILLLLLKHEKAQ